VGLDLREGGAGASPAYKVRGCTFTGSATYGIAVRSFTVAGSTAVDLGTGADPGGNTLTGNGTTSLFLDPPGALTVPAHGNTWNANNEGADGAGQYPAGAVNGPQNGTNFQTPAGTTLAL
jgi:hypothetical protein